MKPTLYKFVDDIAYVLSYLSEYTHDNFKQRFKPEVIQKDLYCLHECGDVMFCTYFSPEHYRVRNIMVFYRYENVFRLSLVDSPRKNYSSICTEYTNIFSEDKEFRPVPKGEGGYNVDSSKFPLFKDIDEDEYFQQSMLYDLPRFETFHKINNLFSYLKENVPVGKGYYSIDIFLRNDLFELVETNSFLNFSLKDNTRMMELMEESFSLFKRDFIK